MYTISVNVERNGYMNVRANANISGILQAKGDNSKAPMFLAFDVDLHVTSTRQVRAGASLSQRSQNNHLWVCRISRKEYLQKHVRQGSRAAILKIEWRIQSLGRCVGTRRAARSVKAVRMGFSNAIQDALAPSFDASSRNDVNAMSGGFKAHASSRYDR